MRSQSPMTISVVYVFFFMTKRFVIVYKVAMPWLSYNEPAKHFFFLTIFLALFWLYLLVPTLTYSRFLTSITSFFCSLGFPSVVLYFLCNLACKCISIYFFDYTNSRYIFYVFFDFQIYNIVTFYAHIIFTAVKSQWSSLA